MSQQSDLAFAHQNDLILIGKQVANRSAALWRTMDLNNLDASWQVVAPKLVRTVTAAQFAAANLSTPYVNAMDEANNYTPTRATLVPEAFTGVMGDGREIAPALFGAVTNTKTLIGRGTSAGQAFESAAHFIALVASSAMQDMARNADGVVAAGKSYTQYIRVVNGTACSRCAILAGIYSSEQAFQRHVHCQCCTAPIVVNVGAKIPSGFHTTPDSFFESLSKAEQDRVFTEAGAEAIRNGADIAKVVNARRGAYGLAGPSLAERPGLKPRLTAVTIGKNADGSPLKVFATNEGRFRGDFRKSENLRSSLAEKSGRYMRTTTLRLMPEQIQVMAGNDPARYRELLSRYGYLQ